MDFSAQINTFRSLGVYEYKFDEVGNVIANSSSLEFSYNYLALPLLNSVYDVESIKSYYDINFTEFVPIQEEEIQVETTETQQQNSQLTEENTQLRATIDELIESSESDSSVARDEAVKNVIIELRIALGEGKEEKDFSIDFPYTPKEI